MKYRINENYKNYFKQKLIESLTEAYMDPSMPSPEPYAEPMMAGGWDRLARGALGLFFRPGVQKLIWKDLIDIPPHVLKSVLNGPYGTMMRTLYRSDDWDAFIKALDDLLWYDKNTGTWFQRLPNAWGETGQNWVQILNGGGTVKVPFNPALGIPPGWLVAAGGALVFVGAAGAATLSQEPELELPQLDPESQEAVAPYRQT